MQAGAWVADSSGRVTFRSRQHDLIFGYSEPLPDWSYERFLEHVLPEERTHVEDTLAEALGAGSDWSVECRIRRSDGEVRWILVGGMQRLDEQGELQMAGIVQDITDRVASEAALRESEARFRAVLEHSLDAAYRRDLWTDTYDYVSPVIESITGYSVEEYAGLTLTGVLEHIHPDDVKPLSAALEQADRTGRLAFEYRFRRKDGRWVWLADRAVVSKDTTGRPGRRSGVLRDITERRGVEESLRQTASALEESERQARDLIEYAPTGIYEIQFHPPRFTHVNDAMCAMTGFSREELLALDPFELMEPDGARLFRSRIEKMLGGGMPDETVEYSVVTKDGARIVVVLQVRLTRDSNGRPRGAFVIGHDVTERRRAEEERERLLDEREMELERTALLRDVAAIVAGSRDERELSRQVLEIAVGRIGADAGAVYVIDDSGEVARAIAHVGIAEDAAGLPEARLGPETVLGQVMESGHAIFSDGTDVPEMTAACVRLAGKHDHRLAAIPIRVRAGAMGALALSFPGRRPFTGDESALLDAVGNQLSVGFYNARMYQTEHRIAETLQETLVVLPSEVPGVLFSRAYESASYEEGVVGGDFVDVFEVSPDVVGITLGDVSGKGIQAAVATSLIRTTLRVHALDSLPVVDIMHKANRVMKRFLETDAFVTLWFGMLDTLSGHLTYVSAGHPPGLVLGRGGAVRTLECLDPFLGAFDDVVYSPCETVVGRGERLVLYSDGVIEARSPDGELFGEARLIELVRGQHLRTTESMSGVLMNSAVDFSRGVLRDDAAVLVVEPTAASGLVRVREARDSGAQTATAP